MRHSFRCFPFYWQPPKGSTKKPLKSYSFNAGGPAFCAWLGSRRCPKGVQKSSDGLYSDAITLSPLTSGWGVPKMDDLIPCVMMDKCVSSLFSGELGRPARTALDMIRGRRSRGCALARVSPNLWEEAQAIPYARVPTNRSHVYRLERQVGSNGPTIEG